MMQLCRLLSAFACLLACAALSPAALAETGNIPERTQFGRNITVEPNEHVSEVTCFGCSVRIRGQVDGDVTVFGGRVVLEDQAEVGGDVTNFGRGVRLEGNVSVGGDVTAFGGAVRRDAGASIGGDVTNFNGSLWLILVFGLPFLIFAGIVFGIVWVVRRLTRASQPVTA